MPWAEIGNMMIRCFGGIKIQSFKNAGANFVFGFAAFETGICILRVGAAPSAVEIGKLLFRLKIMHSLGDADVNFKSGARQSAAVL